MSDVINARVPHRCARNSRCLNASPVADISACKCSCHGHGELSAECDQPGGCGHLHVERMQGGAILEPAGLCEACTTQVERTLPDLPLSYVELELLLSSGSSGITGDIVTSTRDLPIPIRVSVEGLMAAMVFEAETWAEQLAEHVGVRWDTEKTRHCRRGFVLQRAARLLSVMVPTLLRLPEAEYRPAKDAPWIVRDGIGAALELHRLHGLVRFASGQTKLVHNLPAPCPRCERMSLVRRNGSDLVECELCPRKERAWWSIDEYKRLTLVLAGSWRDEAPAHQRFPLTAEAEGTVRGTVHGVRWTEVPRLDFPDLVLVA